MHACCAAAEAKLARIDDNPNVEARRHSLAARPVLGQLSASTNEQGHHVQPQDAQHPVPVLARGFNTHAMPHQFVLCQQQQQQQQQPQVQQQAQGTQFLRPDSNRLADHTQHSLSLAGVHPVQQANAEQTVLMPCLQPTAAYVQNLPGQSLPASHSYPQHSRLDVDINCARTGLHQATARANGPHSHTLQTQLTHSSFSNFQEIQSRARQFAKQMHMLAPLAPRHSRQVRNFAKMPAVSCVHPTLRCKAQYLLNGLQSNVLAQAASACDAIVFCCYAQHA